MLSFEEEVALARRAVASPHPDALRAPSWGAAGVPEGPDAPDSVPEDWSRREIARAHDPAAVWLAEHHPEELEDWPAAQW